MTTQTTLLVSPLTERASLSGTRPAVDFGNIPADYALHQSSRAIPQSDRLSNSERSSARDTSQAAVVWDTVHHRVPPFRPTRRTQDRDDTRVYLNNLERGFITIMFTGLWVNAVSRTWWYHYDFEDSLAFRQRPSYGDRHWEIGVKGYSDILLAEKDREFIQSYPHNYCQCANINNGAALDMTLRLSEIFALLAYLHSPHNAPTLE
jgi:hypothetical protein